MKPQISNIIGFSLFLLCFGVCLTAGIKGHTHHFVMAGASLLLSVMFFFDNHYSQSIYRYLTSKKK